MENLKVIRTTKQICEKFVVQKHYSHRMSIFWEGFALLENDIINGVVVYGQPSPSIQKFAFKNRDFRIYELARLVVQSKSKNAASFLISKSLDMLNDKPAAIVSYADSEYSHCGIVYQASNWLYTGFTISHDHLYLINGKRVHSMSLRDKGITSPKKWAKENNIQTVKPFPKYRYFKFVGSKLQKKKMKKLLNYPIINNYPKCQQIRYDDGNDIII